MDLNLDSLKREILEYLESSGFAVFHTTPGGLEDQPMIIWDSERHPDYRMFLDTARSCGVKLVCFGSREFQPEEIDDLLLQIEESGIPRDEERDFATRLRKFRVHEGVTCALEIAFENSTRLYVYEMQPDWYEEFLNIEDEILSMYGPGDDVEEDDSLGGYFSKN